MDKDDKNRHLSEKEILDITEANMGKTFGELGLSHGRDEANKGGLGAFVEENVFGYDANSDDNPDFIDAGLELKVTPVKQLKSGKFSSKERLVLNMINYVKEGDSTFETSSFYRKNRRLLIWFYLYVQGKSEVDYKITNYNVFEFEKSVELATIRRDWEIIHSKIAAGKAHEISESDTTFLAACTKGANSRVLREQFHSDIPAKPRAYSFKSGFMTRIFRQLVHELAPYSSFVSEDEWLKNPIEEILKDKVSEYIGMTQTELKRLFSINGNPKAIRHYIANRMLDLPVHAIETQTQEMIDANIKGKTIHLDMRGVPHQSMSFPSFDFTELINTPWEDSDIRDDLCDWKFMFFVFQDCEDGEIRFKEALFWNVPNSIVDGPVRKTYEDAAELVRTGDAFEFDKNGNPIDRFPKDVRHGNGCCHIRPHGVNGRDKIILPVKDKRTGITEFYRPSFWFNKQFIRKTVAELEALEID